MCKNTHTYICICVWEHIYIQSLFKVTGHKVGFLCKPANTEDFLLIVMYFKSLKILQSRSHFNLIIQVCLEYFLTRVDWNIRKRCVWIKALQNLKTIKEAIFCDICWFWGQNVSLIWVYVTIKTKNSIVKQ